MLVRNLLKAGEFVEPIPVGIPVTIQYSDTGSLECVYIGCDDKPEDSNKSSLLYSLFVKNSKVPMHVGSHYGTLRVKGVVYSDKHMNACGILPDDIIADLLTHLKSGAGFNVFTGAVDSTSMVFSGAAQVRTWLQGQGFNVLPGFIVPMGDIDSNIAKLMNTTPFSYEWVIGFIKFVGSQYSIEFLEKRQNIVEDITIYLDQSGHVRSQIDLKSDNSLYISYFELASTQIQANDYLLIDSDNSIITKYPEEKSILKSVSYECPFCGKQYVLHDEFGTCPDPHCFSTMYPNLVHFLHRLNVPVISYERFIQLVDFGKFTKFSDILLAPEYGDLELEVSIFDIIDAVIPISVVRNRTCIWDLYIKCNSSWDSISYYLTHPTTISTDLHISDCNSLVMWLQDKTNVETICEILQYTNIVLTSEIKKFEGAPIFRNRHIYLTGKFIHGSQSEVSAILRSYSAKITSFETADCGILGDIPEDVNGGAISYLKNSGKPIFTESEFFKMYDIDSDLA